MFLCPLSCLIGFPLLLVSSVFVIAELSLQLFLTHFYSRLWIKEIQKSFEAFHSFTHPATA